jgi:hypothetical protein
MKHAEMIMVIEAHSEGKAIEYKKIASSEWLSTNHPSFDFCRQLYRVKPTPKYKTQRIDTGREVFKYVEIKALEDSLELSSGMTMNADHIAIYKELYSLLN